MQVKSEIDYLFVLGSQAVAALLTAGTLAKVLYGSLPYCVVAVMVELLKLVFTINITLLNVSFIVQFIMIFNFR